MAYIQESNLVPLDRPLIPGERVIRIGNTLVPCSPDQGFYKCASVDTVNRKWSGYKAILSGGSYTFAETLTENLPYSSVVPVVGKIYTADALARIGYLNGVLPTAGLVLHASLAASSATAETGQTLTPSGTVSYGDVAGIPCATFDGSSYLSLAMDQYLSDLTMSLWFRNTGKNGLILLSFGTPGTVKKTASIYGGNSEIGWSSWADDQVYSTTANTWHHVAITAEHSSAPSGSVSVYVDGVLKGTSSRQWTIDSLNAWIGGNGISMYSYIGNLAQVRVYNRVLSSDELASLASEFNP